MGIILGQFSPYREEDVLLDADDFQDGDILTVDTINDQKVFVGKQPAEKLLYFQINQSGTNAPIVQIIKNEFEVDYINASYSGVGLFTLNFADVVVDATLIARYVYSPQPVFDYLNNFKGFININLDQSASEFDKLVIQTSNTAAILSNSILSDPVTIGIKLI